MGTLMGAPRPSRTPKTTTSELPQGSLEVTNGTPRFTATIPESESRPANDATFQGVITSFNTPRTLVCILDDDKQWPGGKGAGIFYGPRKPAILDDIRRTAAGDRVLVRLDKGYVARIQVMAKASKKPVQSDAKADAVARLAETSKANTFVSHTEENLSDNSKQFGKKRAVAGGYTDRTYPDTSSRKCSRCHLTMKRERDLIEGVCSVCRQR